MVDIKPSTPSLHLAHLVKNTIVKMKYVLRLVENESVPKEWSHIGSLE